MLRAAGLGWQVRLHWLAVRLGWDGRNGPLNPSRVCYVGLDGVLSSSRARVGRAFLKPDRLGTGWLANLRHCLWGCGVGGASFGLWEFELGLCVYTYIYIVWLSVEDSFGMLAQPKLK